MGTMMTYATTGSWGSANKWISSLWLAPKFNSDTQKSTSIIIHGFSFGFTPSPVLAAEEPCLIRAVRRINGTNPGSTSAKPIVRTNSTVVDVGTASLPTPLGTLDSEEMFQIAVPYPLTHFYIPELRPIIQYGNGSTTRESWNLEYYPTVDMPIAVTVWFEVN